MISKASQRVVSVSSRRQLSALRRVMQQNKTPLSRPAESPLVVQAKPTLIKPAITIQPIEPKKKKFSFTGFVFKTILLATAVYGATLYAATKNNTVYDFVLDQQLPYSEEIMEFMEKGKWEDVKDKFEALKAKFIDDASKIEKLTHKLEQQGADFYEKSKETLDNVLKNLPGVGSSSKSSGNDDSYGSSRSNYGSTDVTPAQQLQRPVEVEQKPIEHLPLVKLAATSVDDLVSAAVASFNELLSLIDVGLDASNSRNAELVKNINEKVSILATKVGGLTQAFENEVLTKLKLTQNELLALYTKKELLLTEDLLEQFNQEKKLLEKKLNARLELEILATKALIEQAAVNAVTLMRIEQTKRFEKLIAEKVDLDKNGRLAGLSAVNSRLEQLEQLSGDLKTQLVQNHNKIVIQKAISQLKSVLFAPRYSGEEAHLLAPYFEKLSVAVSQTDDEVLKLAVEDLTNTAGAESTLSLYNSAQLLTRWETLAPELRSASLLPPNAGLLGHFASIVFLKLLIPTKGAKPDGKDIESAIARVESLLTRGELDVAVEEAANLKGWTRKLADDWVVAGRKRLEVEFLVGLIESEAKLL